MREADLYPPIRKWLVDRGYEVHVELFGHDVIALKDGLATVIEMKLYFSFRLMDQLSNAAKWADFVFAAVPSPPKSMNQVRHWGYGLLQVDVAAGKVRQRVGPKQQPFRWHVSRKYRFAKLTGRLPAMEHEVAGLPSNPQLRRQRELRNVEQAAR
ncbi:MAG: hypothetical protein JNK76_20515 [Planctomycetales bacterium]|nr:hypothetical protein [Planctomycetales bacterium]